MGGYNYYELFNDVWYSTDGINWTQATNSAGWSVRAAHTSVVFDGKIWILGGEGYGDLKNDVWYSADGINWTQAINSAAWSARQGHTSVVFGGKIWLIGGDDYSGCKNDVWYSMNGINWISATDSAEWSKRAGCASVIFDNKLWILGGGENAIYKNDVWYSTGLNDIAEGKNDIPIKEVMRITPNPTSSRFNLELNRTDDVVLVYNLAGKLVKQVYWSKQNRQIDISNLPDGVYFLSSKHSNSKILSKVVKIGR
jgi:hypothetical protein